MNPEVAELVGLWSAGAGYYDTFSDEWLIFRPDGTGRLVFLNPYCDESEHFRWRVVSPGIIDLIGTSHQEPEADGYPAGDGYEFHFRGVRYRIVQVERPPSTGNPMRELRLGLEMPWPTTLGFVSDDYKAAEVRLQGE